MWRRNALALALCVVAMGVVAQQIRKLPNARDDDHVEQSGSFLFSMPTSQKMQFVSGYQYGLAATYEFLKLNGKVSYEDACKWLLAVLPRVGMRNQQRLLSELEGSATTWERVWYVWPLATTQETMR